MRRAAVISVVAGGAWITLACAGSGTGSTSAVPPTAGRSAPVRLATDTARYRVASHLSVEQDVNGQTRYSGLELVYFLAVQVARDGERLRATLVLDSVPRYTGSAAVDPTVGAARGAVFQGVLTPSGGLAEFHARDSSLRFVRELAGDLRNFFPRILAAGALTGQRWVDTTEQRTTASTVPIVIRFIGDHEVGAPSTYLDTPALPIHSGIDYTFSGTGSQGGQEFRVEGTGRRAVMEYLGLDGRYLGQAAADTSTFTITLPAVGVTIPNRQTRADTIAVVR